MDPNTDVRRIDLDTYTEGDAEFRKELAGLLISNIIELRESLQNAVRTRKTDRYLSACHKLKTSIGIINADDFAEIVDAIKESLVASEHSAALPDQQLEIFERISDEIIKALQLELKDR